MDTNDETKIVFQSPGKPDAVVTLAQAQSLMRRQFGDDTVDLHILSILEGATVLMRVKGVSVTAKLFQKTA